MNVIEAVATIVGLGLVIAAMWLMVKDELLTARERAVLAWIVVAALVLRLSIAVGTYYTLPYGYFAPDEQGYSATGAQLAQRSLDPMLLLTTQGWFYFNAFLIQLLGLNPLAPRLWNCVVGAFAPVLAYLIAKRLGARSGASVPAVLVAGFPSLVMWSSLNLKDADVWCLILAGILLILQIQDSPRWWSVLGLLLILFVLGTLRQYPVGALVVCLGTALLAPRLVSSRRARAVFADLTVILIGSAALFPSAAETAYSQFGLSGLASMRHNLAIGARSAVDPDPGLETLRGAVLFLPLGLVDLFLRPFPWEVTSTFRLLVAPEVVLYYALLPLVVVGVVYSIKLKFVRAFPVVSFLAVMGIGYALVLGNLGTSYRERAQLLVVMFAFVGVALRLVADRLSDRRMARIVDGA
jgi:hypothetical protein